MRKGAKDTKQVLLEVRGFFKSSASYNFLEFRIFVIYISFIYLSLVYIYIIFFHLYFNQNQLFLDFLHNILI